MDKIKIGCLTYKKLDILTRCAITSIKDEDVEIVIIEGLMDDLILKVKNAIQDGVEVFVGGGANAEIIKKATEAPVLKITLNAFDYLEALVKAKEFGQSIAIVYFQQDPMKNFKQMERLLGLNIQTIVYQEPEELEIKLKDIEIDAVIGASLANEIANKLDIPGVLIYPGEEAIISSIKEAKEMGIVLRREKQKSDIIQAILDFTPSAIIATDEKGSIINYNPAAEKVFGVSARKAMGFPLTKVIPECHLERVLVTKQHQLGVIEEINNCEVVVNRVPIENGGRIVGAVATINQVSEIQKTEQKIRMLNVQKGFTSKFIFSDIIGSSKIIKKSIERAKHYAKTHSNILIYGETGVGKEIFAQSIHAYSLRQNGPFVAVNCAALPENLLESELFGYDEGAFTGSRKGGKAGLFEIAHQGTIFLDEIGEISPALQARLLRVLQEKEVMRIGGDRVIPIDVRIIAATNKDLEEKIPYDFRDDLFYRLNVLQICIPPLRARHDDIKDLFIYFLKKHINMDDFKINVISKKVYILSLYSWPGNIRQLQNVAERFAIELNNTIRFDEDVVRELLVNAIGEDRLINDIFKQYELNYGEKIKNKDMPNSLIQKLMTVFPGQKNKVAEILGISRTTLWRAINEK